MSSGLLNQKIIGLIVFFQALINVIIYTGTYDILNPDVHTFEKLAKEKNLKLDIRETKGAAHIWLIKRYTDKKYDNDKAKAAYNDLVELINE